MVSISHLIATSSCFDFSVTSKHVIPSSTRDFSISDGSIVKKIPVEFPPFNFGWSRKASIEPTSSKNDLMTQLMTRIDGTILLTEDNFKSNVMESNEMWLVLFVDPTKGVFHV